MILASGNSHKIAEFRALFAGNDIDVLAPAELGLALDVAETGSSYYENALLKARAYSNAAGMLALADDSGIEVDALGGAPGVFSARFGGDLLTDEGRVSLLLERLAQVPRPQRSARYRCLLVAAAPDGETWFAEGVCEGFIAAAPRGSNGFGYDPVFLVEGREQTMAELTAAEKNLISHRARAAASMREALRAAAAVAEEAGRGDIQRR